MRELWRPRISIPTLAPDGAGGRRAEEDRRAREKDAHATLTFRDHWNEPDVRGALYAMHGWVCAYCQGPLTESDRGDVEHHRPKNLDDIEPQVYWWLAYVFRNYFLSCRRCNTGHKGSAFPLAPNAVRATYATRAALANEARLLIDPAEDVVEQWLRGRWRDEKNELQSIVVVAEGIDPASVAHMRAMETIDFFKLNERPRLKRARLRCLQEALLHFVRYKENNGAEYHLPKLREMASRYRPFGIFVRNFLEDVDRSLLPTPEEELRWFLDELGEELDHADRMCRGVHVSDYNKRLREEMIFALAALWHDPPPGDAGKQIVEQWLSDNGLIERVRPAYASMELPPSAPRQPASVPPPSKPAPVPA